MVNDQGGVAGRKINFISLDDGFSPPKTVEQVRRLIEHPTGPANVSTHEMFLWIRSRKPPD